MITIIKDTIIIIIIVGFVLGTPHKMYRFVASTVEEKEQWYTALHKHILAQKQLFSKVSYYSE